MKAKYALITFFVLLFLVESDAVAQVNGADVRAKALSVLSDANLESKILFVNVWKSDNYQSRVNTKEFVRVAKIYEQAKLKNGPKGVCFINISLDDPTLWRITVAKDSLQSTYSFENSGDRFNTLLALIGNNPGSIVVGANGDVLASNMRKEDCFTLFRSLITR